MEDLTLLSKDARECGRMVLTTRTFSVKADNVQKKREVLNAAINPLTSTDCNKGHVVN